MTVDSLPNRNAPEHEAGSPYLRDAWYMAGWADQLDGLALQTIALLDEPIVFYRREDGGWTALEDVCRHRLVPLSLGRREGDCLCCMYHGLKFAPDGRCVEIPGQTRVSSAIRVRSYPVAELRGAVWIWMGEPALADEAEIPPIVGPGEPGLAFNCASTDLESSASLVWDNLLDLSHIPFAHEGSFGGGDPTAVAAILKAETEHLVVETLPRGVRTERWHLSKPSYRFLGGQLTDDFVSADFVAPGVLIISTRSYAAGVGAHGRKPPEGAEPLTVRVSGQMVTPLGERRSRIFFHSGVEARFAAMAPEMGRLLDQVLSEDRRFIEAQDAQMRRLPNRAPMNLTMDANSVRFNAIMRGLRDEEHRRAKATSAA